MTFTDITASQDTHSSFWRRLIDFVPDQRTDSFAQAATIYGAKPGCYLMVGPAWQDDKPPGVIVPRAFMAEDPR